MKVILRLIHPAFALSVVLISCGGGAQTASPVSAGEATLALAAPAQPPTSDLSGEILATVVFMSVDAFLQRLTGYALPHLPPPLQALLQPEALKQQLWHKFEHPELGEVLDTSRPLALALAAPEAHSESMMGELLVALPVKRGSDLVAFLRSETDSHKVTPWRDHIFSSARGDFYLRFSADYAFFSGQKTLVQGAAGLLLPLLRQAAPDSIVLHVDMSTLHQRYADKIAQGLAALDQELQARPPSSPSFATGVTQASTMLRKWEDYLAGSHSLSWSIALQPDAVHSRLRMQAKSSGSFRQYLARLNAGEPWGAAYLPQDGLLHVVSRIDKESWLENFELSAQLLQGVAKEHFGPQVIDSWREVFSATQQHLTGESVAAFRLSADGGLSFGFANRVQDSEPARQAILRSWQFLDEELRRLLHQALAPELQQELPGLEIRFLSQPGALTVAGLKGDLSEIVLRWPRLKDEAGQKKLDAAQGVVTALFGPKLLVGSVFVHDVHLMAFGADLRQGLEEMVAIAQGEKDGGMAALVKRHVGAKEMTLFVYAPLAPLAEGLLRLAQQLDVLPPQHEEHAHLVLPGPGHDVPASLLISREAEEALLVEGSISADIFGMIIRHLLAPGEKQADDNIPEGPE